MMNLHLDKDAFRVLIDTISKTTGYRADVLEKDYYVVLILEELARNQQAGLPAYFKGGTALYKAIRATNRFSEDIDLSVDIRDCDSRTQGDKRLEKASKKYTSLPRDSKQGISNRSEVISVYTYDPIVSYDKQDALQRFGKLKVEATSFTISEPTFSMQVSPMIYDLATEEQKRNMEDIYEVVPFHVETITIERIFVDKLFAAEAYVRKSSESNRAFEAAKHIYDLSVIYHHPQIQALFHNDELMKRLLDIRIEEEKERHDGIPDVMPVEFTFFVNAEANADVKKAYTIMQNQYVLRSSDRIDFQEAIQRLKEIKESLARNHIWRFYSEHDNGKEEEAVQFCNEPVSVRDRIEAIKANRVTNSNDIQPDSFEKDNHNNR